MANCEMVVVGGTSGLWIPSRLLPSFLAATEESLELNMLLVREDDPKALEMITSLEYLIRVLRTGIAHGTQGNKTT